MDSLQSGRTSRPTSSASLLQPPPPRKITTPAGDRLSIIMENHGDQAPKIPERNPNRSSTHSGKTWRSRNGSLPRASAETMPPPYARYPWQAAGAMGAEEEKSGRGGILSRSRGGWWRFLIILLVLLVILAIGLGVGLGVGLTKRHKANSSSTPAPAQSSAPAVFPIGEYSLFTALDTVQTNCTSVASTWQCYPYSTYTSSNPSGSEATFNWILSNTSSNYPVNGSTPLTTSDTGVPSNITISSTNNPFAITFANETITYINNASNPHYTFSFTMSKTTVPTTALTSSNQATECFFNNTIFTANLYLSSSVGSVDYPTSMQSSTGVGAATPWPFAVEVSQTSAGGDNLPACYYTTNGNIGALVTDVLQPQAADQRCVCDYRNYGLS